MSRGRPKGYKPYIDISYGDLGDWIGAKGKVRVSRAWWESITGESEPPNPTSENIKEKNEPQPKIEYKLIDLNEI
tara:strand:- start:674 stop:898 length:225 start_codon:yes stop_codon:yes gene_type:complete